MSFLMLAAGIDIGNTTTELLIAEVVPGAVTPLIARRGWTSGPRGGEESLKNAARLLRHAEDTLRRRAEILLITPPQLVLTTSASIPAPAIDQPILRQLGRVCAHTPAGVGFAVGRNVPLQEIDIADHQSGAIVVSVPEGTDFDQAAQRIGAAQDRGLSIVGAVVGGDDAVLISNRIPHTIPIVDEADVSALEAGERIALEVAQPGAQVQHLCDPIALVAAFGLLPSTAPKLAEFARRLADAHCGAVAVNRHTAFDLDIHERGWIEYEENADVIRVPFSREILDHVRAIRPGSVLRAAIPRESSLYSSMGDVQDRVRDVFAVDLPSIQRRVLPREGSVTLNEVPISALISSLESCRTPREALAEASGRPVHMIANETDAARLGAMTTPGVPADTAICDIGGGTIDIVSESERMTAAGGGQLLTVAVAKALSLPERAAEYVKRHTSLRIEAPRLVHYEDGGRRFVDKDLPADAIGRLCFMRRETPIPFSDRLAPEEWRSLRLAVKQHTIGSNVERCLKWLQVTPTTLLLCGGVALDIEAARIVSETVQSMGITVGRANVNGAFGPRYGVALGLVLAFQRMEQD